MFSLHTGIFFQLHQRILFAELKEECVFLCVVSKVQYVGAAVLYKSDTDVAASAK